MSHVQPDPEKCLPSLPASPTKPGLAQVTWKGYSSPAAWISGLLKQHEGVMLSSYSPSLAPIQKDSTHHEPTTGSSVKET